jgi:hypothetical protein
MKGALLLPLKTYCCTIKAGKGSTMDKQQFIEHLRQLDPSGCEMIGREIARSLPNAVGLLEGIADTLVETQCPNLHDIKHARMHHLVMAVTTRLIHCISGLRSLISGTVNGNHKLSNEEQVTASISDLNSVERQMM